MVCDRNLLAARRLRFRGRQEADRLKSLAICRLRQLFNEAGTRPETWDTWVFNPLFRASNVDGKDPTPSFSEYPSLATANSVPQGELNGYARSYYACAQQNTATGSTASCAVSRPRRPSIRSSSQSNCARRESGRIRSINSLFNRLRREICAAVFAMPCQIVRGGHVARPSPMHWKTGAYIMLVWDLNLIDVPGQVARAVPPCAPLGGGWIGRSTTMRVPLGEVDSTAIVPP